LDDLLAGENFVPTASLVARSNLFNPPPSWLAEAPHNDLVFLTMAALSGPLLYVDRSMSVYRKHAGGIHTSDSTAIQQLKCIQTLLAIGDHFDLGGAPALRDGLRYRLRLINDEVRQYENKIRSLEQQHRIDREAMQQTMDSTTFKLGRILSTLRDRLSPSHREVKRGSRSL
jgi:hypothetical protein